MRSPSTSRRPIFDLVVVEIRFDEGEDELYALPVALPRANEPPESALLGLCETGRARPPTRGSSMRPTTVASVGHCTHFRSRGRRVRGTAIELQGNRRVCRNRRPTSVSSSSRALAGEQTNTSYLIGQHPVGKLMRRLEEGRSLELEILEHLERAPTRPERPTSSRRRGGRHRRALRARRSGCLRPTSPTKAMPGK